MIKTVLVTGANGLLGSHIIEALIKDGNFEIHGLIRASSDNSINNRVAEKVTWHTGDVNDIFSLNDIFRTINIVIHTAGFVSYNPRKSKNIHNVNVLGTANVCNVALTQNVEKIVHISSIAALSKYENQDIINEQSDWINSVYNTNYAISKYLGEMEVWRAISEGLNGTILNPSIILGCGDWNKSSLQFLPKLAKGGTVYPIGSTGFVDVKDVAAIAVMAIDDKYNDERYIISGHNLSYKYFFDALTSRLGVQQAYIPMTRNINAILWRLEFLKNLITGKDPLITKQTANNSMLSTQYDNSKSINHFNFRYTPIENTLDEMVESFINENRSNYTKSNLYV